MIRRAVRSLRLKVMLLLLASAVLALTFSAIGLVITDLRAYEHQVSNDVRTQADIVGRAAGAALSFSDRSAAGEDLASLRLRPEILAAALYDRDGKLFASYSPKSADFPPPRPGEGYGVEGSTLVVWAPVFERNERVGSIMLRSSYDPLTHLREYLGVVLFVMALSMGVALLLSGWLQRGITDPVLEVARVAREVQRKRDYSLRARKTTEDEIGQLVDAFNDMLAEAAERTALLHQADRNKDEFLATLAHELRNPLAPIRNAVEILKLRGSDPQIASKALEMMSRQLGQMVRLVDDLLDVSRITTGKLVVRKEPIDLQAVIDSALESTQTFVQGQKHELAIERPQGKLMMEGDFTRLAQVFANLVHNAAKYTTAGGKVGISIRSEENAYVVQVRDSGVGISAEMLPRIFDMFVQAEHGPESLKAGLGVGLTLARRLVELHGGTLAVASSGLGQGSEFTVRLPVATPEVPAVTAPTPARRGAVPHRVLVADDNEDFVTSMSTLLRGAGHDVRVAKDGVEALEVAEQFEPEFAFIDIGMPRLNGYDVAKRLREQTTQTMLIAITGWGQEEDRRRAHAAGFHRHLTKPVDPAEIESILASQ